MQWQGSRNGKVGSNCNCSDKKTRMEQLSVCCFLKSERSRGTCVACRYSLLLNVQTEQSQGCTRAVDISPSSRWPAEDLHSRIDTRRRADFLFNRPEVTRPPTRRRWCRGWAMVWAMVVHFQTRRDRKGGPLCYRILQHTCRRAGGALWELPSGQVLSAPMEHPLMHGTPAPLIKEYDVRRLSDPCSVRTGQELEAPAMNLGAGNFY